MAVKRKEFRLLPLALAMFCGSALADVWVLEPSISLDQRFDDNFTLELGNPDTLSATRVVGELGLSRESQAYSLRGLILVDGRFLVSNDDADSDLDSNQIVAFDAGFRTARSRYGVRVGFKQDTPSRDIAADLTDPNSIAPSTGLDLTESSDVARREVTLTPRFEYDYSRRLILNANANLTIVNHDLPDAQDAIFERFLSGLEVDGDGNFLEPLLPFDEVTLEDAGGPFSPSGELDDFNEVEADVGLRFKLSPISTFTTTLGFSRFQADVLIDPFAIVPFEELEPDSDEPGILRRPRRDSISTTSRLELGYERFVSPTLQVGVAGGIFVNTTDTTDTLRAEDRPGEEIPIERLEALETDNTGWLARLTLTKDAGRTRYTGRFSVDVEPSSVGSQLETLELTTDVNHVLSPRLNLSLRARASEPDRLGANVADSFARRFISIEPRIQWNYTRNWVVSAAYRYRRQKARIDPQSADSNAVLFSVKYTPPSKVRDAARENGL